MKALNVLASLALALPVLANAANPQRLVCESRNHSTVVVIEQLQDLTPPQGAINATASMLLVKVNGRKSGGRITLAGSKEDSAKGPYYQLSGSDGYAFFISAAASKSPSELLVGKSKIEVDCD